MTTKHNADTREARAVSALLWFTNISGTPLAAPEQYGGRPWNVQFNILSECAKREGITLGDDELFAAHVSGDRTTQERLGKLLEFEDRYPTRRLFVPGSVFADLSPDDRTMYITTLYAHDTELIFCTA